MLGANSNSVSKSSRIVCCEDALLWLKKSGVLSGSSLVASLPDISEFPKYSSEQWKAWFIEAALLILQSTPNEAVTIFYQSDIKLDGVWIDKGFLCQKAAEQAGHALLWHKIACRGLAGQATFGRPGYSHILCFSKSLKLEVSRASADVIAEPGEKIWPRGMGLKTCLFISEFIATQTNTTTIVNPFCGQGSMLAAANEVGLSSIGIERSPKRAEIAGRLSIDRVNLKWVL